MPSRTRAARSIGILLCTLLSAPSLLAHETGASFLELEITDRRIEGRWEIAAGDLGDVDPRVVGGGSFWSVEEAARDFPLLRAYARARLSLRADGSPLDLHWMARGIEVERTDRGTNFHLVMETECPRKPGQLEVEYRLLFETLPEHRGLLLLQCDGQTQTAMFTPERTVCLFDLTAPDRGREFRTFLWEGVWHIWIGYDHILFLVALLLPSVLRWEKDGWRPEARFRTACWNVFLIVTSFTVAHSITLSVGALGIVSLPARWVESLIALSVFLAALNNIHPVLHRRTWAVAFGFGLIHGFGFANVLAEVGLPSVHLAAALVAFNLGVELGQIAIVSLVLPVAFAIRTYPRYPKLWMPLGSGGIALLALVWMLERVLGLG